MRLWRTKSNIEHRTSNITHRTSFLPNHPRLNELLIQSFQESRRLRQNHPGLSIVNIDGIGDEEMFLGARAGDVHETAFFLERVEIIDGARGGESAVERIDDEHAVPFQPLGAVDRRERQILILLAR